ncbi:hypothetical protein J7K99_06200, partial [bacterium]|nr:hypothetical protein [bacterium]
NADGSSTADVVVWLFDVNGNYVVDETPVTLLTDIGTITSPVNSYNECYGARADATYTSATVSQDDYCSDNRARTATITARAGFAEETATIDLLHSECSSENSTISAPSSVPGGGDFSVVVTVKDQWGNPICGETVSLTSAVGAPVSPPSTTTNSIGAAVFDVTALSDTVDINDLLTATFGACAVWTNVTYSAGKGGAPVPDSTESAGRVNPVEKSDTAAVVPRE